MSSPSRWPLPADGLRFVLPKFARETVAEDPLTRDCYPTAFGYYPSATGHRMTRRQHDDHLLIYCTEGQGSWRVGRNWRGLSAGEILLLPRGVAHRYRADQSNPWSLYWCHFEGEAADAWLNQEGLSEQAALLGVGQSVELVASFRDLFTAHQTGFRHDQLVHAAVQIRRLLTLLPLERQTQNTRRSRVFDLDKIHAFMWSNLARPVSLDELARLANMSKFHFASVYKQHTGHSPMRHFMLMKMEQACRLLDSSDLSIAEVAERLGYDDPLYFSRVFRHSLGRSPSEYRHHH